MRKHFSIKIALLVLLCMIQMPAFSGVYCCTQSDGKSEFRDTPCQSGSETQTFLPLSYGKTDPKQLKKQETELKKSHQRLIQSQKKKDRVHQKKLKQLNLEKSKTERREVRCLGIQEKIDLLEAQLRQGCKLKKSIRLQSQIEQAERMKQRYCTAEER